MRILPSTSLSLLLLLAACRSPGSGRALPVMEPFGTTQDGRPVQLFTLTNADGMLARITNFGATLVELHVPDRQGRMADVVLGFDDLSGYEGPENPYFGCTVGRVANRIAGGRFSLGGESYVLATNDGPNHLHGGQRGFGQRVWEAEGLATAEGQGLRLRYVSPDGEEGYPGTLTAQVTYTLTDAGELRMEYQAESSAPTPVNLTHHSYFNLAGHGSPTVLDHELEIRANHYTPTDDTLIPTGDLRHVADTALDFRQPRRLGERIAALEDTAARGYDHNFAIGRWTGELHFACRLVDPRSGRVMTVDTTEPGLQLYSGNLLSGQTGKEGRVYARRSAVCLEAQHFPDTVNQAHFPDTILIPGATYTQTTIYGFSAR